MKTGFVYIWFDKQKKMYYIGSHWGTEDDGYVCSSEWMKRAYRRRPQDFKRRIIQTGIDKDNTVIEEDKWLSQIKQNELGARYYNLQKHTKGLQKAWRGNRGRKQSPEEKEKRAEKLRGQKRSDETREKMRKAQLTPEAIKRNREKILGEKNYFYDKRLTGEQNGFYGKKHSDKTKHKLSEANKGMTFPNRPSNAKGTVWWTNGIINKRCVNCPGDNWSKGRKK